VKRSHQVDAGVDEALNFLASQPGVGFTTLTHATLRALLLKSEGVFMAQGHLWEITSKPRGAGVYEVSSKRRVQ